MNEFLKRSSILEKKIAYQTAFFIVLLSTILLNVIFKIDPELFLEGSFIVVSILMGIGFRHIHIGYIFIISAGLSCLSGSLGNVGFHGKDLLFYLFHWLSYFLVSAVIKMLILRFEKDQEDTILLVKTLSKALDARDAYTAFHSENVAKYSYLIAEKLKLRPMMRQDIFIGALLHDIGKIGIPENVLNKPGRLTEAEYACIKNHPQKGHDMVSHISKFKKNGLLDTILYHHERYDGSGYPFGKKGENIPLAARIVSVADAFDAMTSMRIYRNEPFSMNHVMSEIKKNSGIQFDPVVVGAFIDLINEEKIKIDMNQLWTVTRKNRI